tara:strand:- start:12721 stop:14133 length:1413 start_codon:yes stop_codon:yes gene_type:complete
MEINVTVILGMHRSGTSLLAAGLSHCGLNFGDELMGGTEFNLKGHWEDNDIVSFNNRVLQELGLEWDSLDFISNDAWESHAFSTLVDEGCLLLNNKLALSNGKFAFKDPRTIRVLPIWLEIFKKANIEPNYVFIIRNPLDVGKSLSKRENKPVSLSQLLWLHHNIGQLQSLNAGSQKLCVVDFYDFCKDPKKVLLWLSSQLSFAVSENKLNEFSDVFYDEKLVSQQTDPYQLSENNKVFKFVFDAYRQLRAFSNSHSNKLEPLIKLEQFWQSVGPYLCEQHIILHEENLSNQRALRDRLSEEINSIKEYNEDRAKSVAVASLIGEFDGVKSDFNTGFTRLSNLLQSNSSEVTNNILNRQEQFFNHLNEDSLNLKIMLEKLINQQEKLFNYSNEEYTDLKQMLADYISKKAEGNFDKSKLKDELKQSQSHLERITKVLLTKEDEVKALRNSFSWKITSPLRSISAFFSFKS